MFSVDPNQSSYFLDKSYEQTALKLIEKIKSNEEEEDFQPLTPISDFFVTAKKIESLETRNGIFLTAFLEFSSKSNVQWIALKIAKQEAQPKNTYLYNLIEACKKTNSKEMAFKAAEELEISSYKKNKVIQNLSDHFNFGQSKSLFKG